jgi:hypothetical protein
METEIMSTENATIVNGAPLTTTITNENAPELLRNAIDQRIVKIRPMATPIDQISRCANARHASSMKVDYYSVGVKDVSATVSSASVVGNNEDAVSKGYVLMRLIVDKYDLFSPSETLIIPDVTFNDSGNVVSFYVISKDRDKGLLVAAIGAKLDEEDADNTNFTAITSGMTVVRMGRAATELDVQTAQFESLPKKETNNCQIFKMQVEQSTFQRLANKEVGWSFSDQEEVAIIDMRLGMEKNFIFGSDAVIVDPEKKEEVYLTRGIWNQTDHTFEYNPLSFGNDTLIELSRQAFTGTGGSSRKIIIGGSGFIELLSKLEVTAMRNAASTFVKWGIEFNEIKTNFGTLYVIHSEIFDQCGREDDAFVLDPAYMTKYSHVPFHTEKLDLRRSGVRNTDAIVITEASCLVLRHPKTHMKIVAKTPTLTPSPKL